MSNSCEFLVVIPARGGSKRLPRKNILPLAGRPMICWTIDCALSAKISGRILVSSDDEDILSVAKQYVHLGIMVHKRPKELAGEHSTTTDVLLDALAAAQYNGFFPDALILLQPTSPLRIADDINSAVQAFASGDGSTVVSVSEVGHPTAWCGKILSDNSFVGVDFKSKRAQDCEKEYLLNGAVYIFDRSFFVLNNTIYTDRIIAYVMPKERSVDIDDFFDFKVCEALLFGRLG